MMLEKVLAYLIIAGAYAVCFALLGYCILSGASAMADEAKEREEREGKQ
jgi:hypothetical protein